MNWETLEPIENKLWDSRTDRNGNFENYEALELSESIDFAYVFQATQNHRTSSSVPNHALRSHGEKSIRTSHRYEFRVLQHCTKAPLPDQSFPSPLKGKGKLWPGRGATVHQMNHSLENPTFRTYDSPACFFSPWLLSASSWCSQNEKQQNRRLCNEPCGNEVWVSSTDRKWTVRL